MNNTVAQPLAAPLPVSPMQAAPSRTWLAMAMGRTARRTGARLGLVWLVLVTASAILAPLLANSAPLLIKIDGRISSPLLNYLTGADVTLLALGVAAVLILPFRQLAGRRVLSLLFLVLLIAPLAHWNDLLSISLLPAPEGEPRRFLPVLKSILKILVVLLNLGALLLVALRMARNPLDANGPRTYRLPIVLLLAAAPLAAALLIWPINPPATWVRSMYREAATSGHVQWVINTPIPYSPTDRLREQFTIDRPHPWQPSWIQGWHNHHLGTDIDGADILSNMIHACRIAMSIGFISTGIAVLIGITIGSLMGYFVGWVDLLGMRLVEIFGSLPTIYLLLTFVAFFDRSIHMIMVIIGLTSWTGDARFIRAEILKLREQDFVHAARAAGLPLRSILFRHLMPNALAPVLVTASFGVASAIMAEATLSFLGLGLIEEPSWGRLLEMARSATGGFHWWIAVFPGFAIFLTVLAYNLIGESLRDAIDPRAQVRSE